MCTCPHIMQSSPRAFVSMSSFSRLNMHGFTSFLANYIMRCPGGNVKMKPNATNCTKLDISLFLLAICQVEIYMTNPLSMRRSSSGISEEEPLVHGDDFFNESFLVHVFHSPRVNLLLSSSCSQILLSMVSRAHLSLQVCQVHQFHQVVRFSPTER